MKFLQVTILALSLLLLLQLLVVESSSSTSDNFMSNITRGSSLSLNDSNPSYWLSPSGNIAFGFYQLPCTRSSPSCPDRYVVGIWFVKSPSKTLVWRANPNDLPLHKPSSILFTDNGKLVLQIIPDNKEKPLIPDIQELVSYAMMHDNGNFVLYGSKSQIVWESFDYPTDTILGGQKLRPGVDLVSGGNRLSVQQANGLVAISDAQTSEKSVSVISDAIKGSLWRPITLSLDITGELYLVGSNDVVLKYLYRNKNRKEEEGSIAKEDFHVYKATVDSGGHFNLHEERIDGNILDHEKSSSILLGRWPVYHRHISVGSICLVAILGFLTLCSWIAVCIKSFYHP